MPPSSRSPLEGAARVALPTRKRETRQARKGATVARKRVAGPSPIPRKLPVSPFAEVQLVTARELRKSFRSVKGIVLAAVSLAGGAAVAMLFAWLDRVQRDHRQINAASECGRRQSMAIEQGQRGARP